MSVNRSMRIGLIFCALGAIAACGDDDDDGDNGGTPDAANEQFDATPAATHFGQSLAVQLKIPVPGAPPQGFVLENTFEPYSDIMQAVYEEMPGSPFACKAYELGPDTWFPGVPAIEGTHLADNVDEGTMQVSINDDPVSFPPCNFVDNVGYFCVSTTGSGGAIAVADAGMNLFSINNADVTFDAGDAGRFVQITGSAVPGNNGRFPIFMRPDANTIVYQNPQCMADVDACAEDTTAANYMVLAGLPGGSTPEVPNGSTVTFDFTAGGAGDVESFTRDVAIADQFTLTDESAGLMFNIPIDGNGFSITCDGEGGDCGTAMASLLVVLTTDTPIPEGAPGAFMPIPTEKAVQLICLFLSGTATVPDAAAAYLADSNATRVRALFGRANPAQFRSGNTDIQLIAGNATAGVTNIE